MWKGKEWKRERQETYDVFANCLLPLSLFLQMAERKWMSWDWLRDGYSHFPNPTSFPFLSILKGFHYLGSIRFPLEHEFDPKWNLERMGEWEQRSYNFESPNSHSLFPYSYLFQFLTGKGKWGKIRDRGCPKGAVKPRQPRNESRTFLYFSFPGIGWKRRSGREER